MKPPCGGARPMLPPAAKWFDSGRTRILGEDLIPGNVVAAVVHRVVEGGDVLSVFNCFEHQLVLRRPLTTAAGTPCRKLPGCER